LIESSLRSMRMRVDASQSNGRAGARNFSMIGL
jgi:hypothetical protein